MPSQNKAKKFNLSASANLRLGFGCGATILILMNLAFADLKQYGALTALGIIGVVIFALAYWGWRQLPETYGKDLDYEEL